MFTLYTPFRTIGGVEQLVVSLSREMREQHLPHKVLAPKGGVVWDLLAGELPPDRLLDVTPAFGKGPRPPDAREWRRQALAPNDLLLLPNPQDALRLRFPNPRVLWWNVFPETLALGRTRLVRLINLPLKAHLLRYLIRNNSVCFMDETGVRWLTRVFRVSIPHPLFLPLPVRAEGPNRYLDKPFPPPDRVTLTSVGRAVDWKVLPFAHFLNQASALLPIETVHVFTDDAGKFRRLLSGRCAFPSERLSFHEGVYDNALKSQIASLGDLHFAMGTSALDGAGVGVPTVLLDAFNDLSLTHLARYRWVHEARAQPLGELMTPENPVSRGRPLAELIPEWQADPRRLSQLGYAYVRDEHGLAPICRRLVELAFNAAGRLRRIHLATALDAAEHLPTWLGWSRTAPPRATPFA